MYVGTRTWSKGLVSSSWKSPLSSRLRRNLVGVGVWSGGVKRQMTHSLGGGEGGGMQHTNQLISSLQL